MLVNKNSQYAIIGKEKHLVCEIRQKMSIFANEITNTR